MLIRPATPADLPALTLLLQAVVEGGGSVGFVLPLTHSAATAFWRDNVLPAAQAGGLHLLVAEQAGQVLGTVQLDLRMPPNQPHRADVKKLLVHPRARRQGIARQLMLAVEAQARQSHRTLLVLDTVVGGAAEQLYLSLGYHSCGVIPGYALDVHGQSPEATHILYKQLA